METMLSQVRIGSYVIAADFFGEPDEDARSMRVLRFFEHNGRKAFDARVCTRDGDSEEFKANREVWRYLDQVRRIKRR